MSKHFYYKMSKMSKWVNEQNAHMRKFGVKWAPEVQIYYKNTLGVPCSWYTRVYHEWTPQLRHNNTIIIYKFSTPSLAIIHDFEPFLILHF